MMDYYLQSLEQARDNIKLLTDISKHHGLEINKEKSNIIIFNMTDQPEMINEIKVTTSIKYLGITINNSRNIFTLHKQQMFQKAEKMANLTYPVIAKSCNKIIIGKTYWKSVSLPSILFGANTMCLNKSDRQTDYKEPKIKYIGRC